MDNEILKAIREIIKEEIQPIKEDIRGIKTDITELKEGQKNIINLLNELEPKNAKRHLEINSKIDRVENDIKYIKQELQKVEVVTGKNCIEIEYLKAVK